MAIKRKRSLPLPEIIQPGRMWHVVEGSGYVTVNPDDKGIFQMGVPRLRGDSHARAVLKHEYCHIAFTPKGEILTDTEQAMEDYRVNTLGFNAGINFGEGFSEEIIKAKIAYEGVKKDFKALILSMVAALPTNQGLAQREGFPHLSERMRKLFSQVIGRLDNYDDERKENSFKNMRATAKWFDEQFPKDLEKDDEEAEAEEAKKAATSGKPGKSKRTKFKMPASKELEGFGNPVYDSGELSIETPPLVRNLKSQAGYCKKLSDSGVLLRRPGRFMVDKKIFERRAKNNGGTILIDVSGSMQLNDEMILLLIEKKPAAKIAIYAGNSDSNQGTVRVIVQKGKAAAPKDIDVDSLGGGNVVDYPALLWLIQQEKPYFWICDGQLTGRNDSGYTSINVGCSKIQKRANILRWSSVKRFLEGQRGQLNISSREED